MNANERNKANYLRYKQRSIDKLKTQIVGKRNLQLNGKVGKVIAARGLRDIDVESEDGIVIKHVSLQRFRNGVLNFDEIESEVKDERDS